MPAEIQGRQMRVFRLDFVSARDLETAIKPMLSPVGQAFTIETKTQDNRRTQEAVAVQDLPSYLRTIERYVAQLDRPPRQVLIEAHILSVDLNSELTHGVDFKHLFAHLAQANLQVGAVPPLLQGLSAANPPGSFLFTFDGSHFDLIVQALRTQTAAKTLASPKVLVLNGQEARFQLGKQLGYRVQTATETSTLESVNFLDVGKVLRVTPRITADSRILMHVKPEVSDGEVDDKTGLPNSVTTQVETDVMLPDGRGMVIGGLIDEKDIEQQQKVPVLGDIWLVGRIFQRRSVTRQRQEVIICLLPRIVPDDLACDDRHEFEAMRAQTPLVTPELDRYPRPWEGALPDAVEKPFRVKNYLPGAKQCRVAEGEPPSYGCPVETIPYYSGGLPADAAPLPSDQSAEESRQDPTRQAARKSVTYPEPSGKR
jgi:type II secretory pathway component GspD/PulD (secretin)